MSLKTMIYNFYNNFGEEQNLQEDDDDFDDDDGEEDDEEVEEVESQFGEDIGDGYGDDTIDPLDAQEKAEMGEDENLNKDKEKSSNKDKKEKQQQKKQNTKGRVKGRFNKKMATQIAKKHPFSMSNHVEARCVFCRKQSIVRCKKQYIRISTATLRIVAHKRFTGFYCVNPKCKMSFQRDYIQMAAGNLYQGSVIPMRELLKVSKT